MSTPAVDNSHVAEGQALFTDRFKPQAVLNGFAKSYLASVQDLENAIWSVINSCILGNANCVGVWLTWVADLVGQDRGNLIDADLLTATKLRILANKSGGRAEDVIKIAAQLANPNTANYIEAQPMKFTVEAWNINGALPAANLLAQARCAGSYGVLHYSTWPESGVVLYRSRYIATPGNGVYSSRYGVVSNAGTWAAAAALLE